VSLHAGILFVVVEWTHGSAYSKIAQKVPDGFGCRLEYIVSLYKLNCRPWTYATCAKFLIKNSARGNVRDIRNSALLWSRKGFSVVKPLKPKKWGTTCHTKGCMQGYDCQFQHTTVNIRVIRRPAKCLSPMHVHSYCVLWHWTVQHVSYCHASAGVVERVPKFSLS